MAMTTPLSWLADRWRSSLAAQTAALMLACLVAAQWTSIWAFCDERAAALRTVATDMAAREVALIAAADPKDVEVWSRDALHVWRSEARPQQVPSAVASALEPPRRIGAAWAAEGPATGAALAWTTDADGVSRAELGYHAAVVAAPIEGGGWIGALAPMPTWTDPWATQNWSALFFTSLTLMAAALMISRKVTAPLRALGTAADGFAGGTPSPVAIHGPREVSRTMAAFNAMQDRVAALLEERTRMLSALGHDLRTPMARLRLRAHLVEDEEIRLPALDDLDEIGSLTERALDLARGAAPETPEPTELGRLLVEVSDGLTAAGMPTVVEMPLEPHTIVEVRSGALRRAIANLGENASRYGGGGTLSLERSAEAIRLVVRDRGPGIPAARLEDVRAPFVRLDRSRARHTGGAGLGLALAEAAARDHGGRLVLRNRDGGGLEASIDLSPA